MRLYAGSDGGFYTEYDFTYKIETGAWTAHMWDPDEGWELVEAPGEEVIWLIPIEESDLPRGLKVQPLDGGSTIADSREG